ncbi:MAG: hypothetical protein IJP58_01935, partial [Clostridia bacterium]|nr:hypothetical protein [Clostridia bacterium]
GNICGKAFSTAVYRYNIAANTSAGNSKADDHFVSIDGDKGYNYIYNNLFYNNLNVSSLHYIVQNTATLTQNSPACCAGCRLSSGIYDPGFRQNGRAPQGRYLHRQPEFAKGTVPLATM